MGVSAKFTFTCDKCQISVVGETEMRPSGWHFIIVESKFRRGLEFKDRVVVNGIFCEGCTERIGLNWEEMKP
jgi:hypothetical protein